MELNINAPAKVNLFLRVIGSRPDGYHDLFMVMEKLSLFDEIGLREIPSGIELVVEGEDVDAGMVAEKNLAYRAAQLFKEAADEKRGVRIHLKKKIPVAAGLGGGSSDAAAVLKGLNRLWQKNWSSQSLAALGAKIGADVPFFCYDGPAVAEGTGERITPLSKLPKLFFLLINPGFAVSTPWVYKEFDRQDGLLKTASNQMDDKGNFELTPPTLDARFRRLASREFNGGFARRRFSGELFCDFRDVAASLYNDLEKVTVAKYPEIKTIKEFLLDQGAQGALMAGSGPTVFGVFESAKVRDGALDRKSKPHWKTFATDNLYIP